MHFRYPFALGSLLIMTTCCAAEEFLLLVEEVEGVQPKVEQATDGAAAYYGWMPASSDHKPFRVVRSIELRVSTEIDFQLRLNQGGERRELKGRLQAQGDSHIDAPVLSIGDWRVPLARGETPDSHFVLQYEYAIEDEMENGLADVPSYRRKYAQGSLPISRERNFYLGGGQHGTRPFPATLWSLKAVKPEPGQGESNRVHDKHARSTKP